MRIWLKILVTTFTLYLTPGLAAEATTLAAPTFECDLPAFRNSGDATNETRQLRNLEQKFSKCVKTYKSKLRVQREKIVALEAQTSDKIVLEHIETALTFIDQVLASDLKPTSNSPALDRRDFVDPHHGG